jgi:hypothetical protein
MKVVFLGMPARDAAALKIFIDVGMPGWHSQAFTPRAGVALPPADVYIVDLAGLGLLQWSARAEADLAMLLGGHSALLLAVAHNTSWHDKTHAMQGRGRQRISCLAKPYGREDMRAALAGLVADPAPAGLTAAAATRSQPPQAPSFLPLPAAAGRPAVAAPLASLSGSLQAVRTVFPDLQKHLLLCKLLDLLATGHPCELRLSVHQTLVLHPAQGWVAHNLAPGVLARLAVQGQAVSSMSVRDLGDEAAVQRLRPLLPVRENLDTFLWGLAEASIGEQTPPARCDAELSLRSMPGFTRLPGTGHLQLQLAAICVRVPQTLSGLRAAFPAQDAQAMARFMLLSTVCGLGRLQLADTPGPGRTAPAMRPARAQPGFFRAMLNKLF